MIRTITFILALVVLPLTYLVFRDYIVTNWNNFESVTALVTYMIAVLSLYYQSSFKFFFRVRAFVLRFRHDYVTWRIAGRYDGLPKDYRFPLLIEAVLQHGLSIQNQDKNSVTGYLHGKIPITLRIENHYDTSSISLSTSKFDVPFRATKSIKRNFRDLSRMLTSLTASKSTRFDLTIEYHDKSPFYSYWVRSLPETEIESFEVKIQAEKLESGSIKVHKNSAIISSEDFEILLDDAEILMKYQGI